MSGVYNFDGCHSQGDRMNETRKATTFKLFQKTLHPGCFIDDPKNPTEKKIRKHTRAAINRVVGEIKICIVIIIAFQKKKELKILYI